MALQKTVKVKNNFGEMTELKDCYIKIIRVAGDKQNVSIVLGFYDSSQQNQYFTKNYGFVPKVNEGSDNFIKQGYAYLKTTDEFYNAIDV